MTREERFLQNTGWGQAERHPLAGDASARRYERLSRPDGSAILMDMSPPLDIHAFLDIDTHLASLGCSVPSILAADADQGLAVIEDFGDASFSSLLDNGHPSEDLYTLAVDQLIALHSQPKAAAPFLQPYDEERFLNEAILLADWFMPCIYGLPNMRARQEYVDIWTAILKGMPKVPHSIVLRDYFPANLMLLERDGLAACGLLDFQDALSGPVTYDLVSLLEDARRDVDPALRVAMKGRYLEAFPKIKRDAFEKSWAILAAQRHAKVIGLFVRLCVRDGKSGYLCHLPRLWRLFEEVCSAHRALKDLKKWLDRHIPPLFRTIPQGLSAA